MFCSDDTTSACGSPVLPDELRAMRAEIDAVLDDVCQECEGLPASGISQIFRRRLIPIVEKHFSDD
jgi:hypothetical protein